MPGGEGSLGEKRGTMRGSKASLMGLTVASYDAELEIDRSVVGTDIRFSPLAWVGLEITSPTGEAFEAYALNTDDARAIDGWEVFSPAWERANPGVPLPTVAKTLAAIVARETLC